MTITADIVSLSDYQRRFQQSVAPEIVAYIDGYAADGVTHKRNRTVYDELCLLPRVLGKFDHATTALSLFGASLPSPIILAPTAYHKLVHPDGEKATAKAVSLTGNTMCVSAQSSVLLEELAAFGADQLWMQLYMRRQRAETLDMIKRAEDSGYRALVITVDAPVSGVRNVEQRSGFALPPHIRAVNLERYQQEDIPQKKAGSPVFQGMLHNVPDWETLRWISSKSHLPVLVKGILHPLDAERALENGVAGIIISNHGGRTLDTTPATLNLLPLIAQKVNGRIPVLIDGNIRRGTDIVKALALGASAVLIGRPVLHALAVGGMSGIAHMLTILQTEFEMAMALCGCEYLADITPDIIFHKHMSVL